MTTMILGILNVVAPIVVRLLMRWMDKAETRSIKDRDKVRQRKRTLIEKITRAEGDEQKKLVEEFLDKFSGSPGS